MTITRPPYGGSSRKLVLAIDIGTTYSGVCYAFLDPGVAPEIKPVTTFLNNNCKDFKTSSVLYYHRDGKFCGAGDPAQWSNAEDLHQVKWWKLMLAKGELPAEAKRQMTTAPPTGKTIVDLFSDFIRYLFDSTIAHIKEAEPTGDTLWENFGPRVELVLTHPNDWEGQQQEVMRKAVVQAGIFTAEEVRNRLSFVTEGEASFNHCVTYTKSGESLEPGHKVLVVDAGGGTIDISSYTVRSKSPLKVEELHLPKCAYQGAEFVTARVRGWARGKFKNSKFDTESDLDTFTECFDKGLKGVFWEESKSQFVKFGSARDKDSRCDVKGGKMMLQGAQVAIFFKPCLDAVLEVIKGIAGDLDPGNTFVFLVGGFAGSPWLFKGIARELAAFGLKLSRPDTQTNKAVAFGAISYYLDHFITSRLVRYTYGAITHVDFDPGDPEHRQRSQKKRMSATGGFVLEVFAPILMKGRQVSETEEFSDRFARIGPFPPTAVPQKLEVIRYKGTQEKPQWIDLEPDNFETACHVVADLRKIPCLSFVSSLGIPCFIQAYDVVYIHGQTQFKAYLRWTEEDEEKLYLFLADPQLFERTNPFIEAMPRFFTEG